MNNYVFEKERPLAQTKYGTLRGVTYGGVNIFMGVQYAHAKRFQMPTEIEPWEGIKNAYQHGPVAMQAMDTNPFFYYRGLHMLEKQSEDCQNLNIWAPKTLNGEPKPVFVFMHGGGYFAGNAFEEISFDGFNMAHNGDVIFVSINHRLNIMGYLNLADYGEEYKNSANAGIADLVMALKWIHENIAAFGGDPENVTICGHSGGGGKVQCMLQIEEAAPYFQKAMVMSGAMGDGMGANTEETSRALAKKIMDELGITKENIEKINEVPFAELARVTRKMGMGAMFQMSPVPNDYFPGFPMKVGLMPYSKDKIVIYSSVIAEFPMVHLTAEEKLAMTEEDQIAFIRKQYGDKADYMMDLFRKAYPDHQILDLAYLDGNCRSATVASAQAHAAAGSENTYLLMCSYTVPEDGWLPIWHGGEMAYIFQNEDCVLVLNEAVYGQKYAEALSTLTLNLCKNGDPNNKYLPKWEPVTVGNNKTMIIDRVSRLENNYDKELVAGVNKYGPKMEIKISHSID